MCIAWVMVVPWRVLVSILSEPAVEQVCLLEGWTLLLWVDLHFGTWVCLAFSALATGTTHCIALCTSAEQVVHNALLLCYAAGALCTVLVTAGRLVCAT